MELCFKSVTAEFKHIIDETTEEERTMRGSDAGSAGRC